MSLSGPACRCLYITAWSIPFQGIHYLSCCHLWMRPSFSWTQDYLFREFMNPVEAVRGLGGTCSTLLRLGNSWIQTTAYSINQPLSTMVPSRVSPGSCFLVRMPGIVGNSCERSGGVGRWSVDYHSEKTGGNRRLWDRESPPFVVLSLPSRSP